MSLLTIVQDVAVELGIPSPDTVISSLDEQVIQLRGLANAEGRDLCSRFNWQALIVEKTFLTTAAELQGTIAALVSAGDFKHIINDTIWDRTQSRQIFGSIPLQTWQRVQASNVSGPHEEYQIRGGSLFILPAPAASSTMAFFYKSKHWCQSSGGAGQAAWAADDDTGVLDENLMGLGLKWRFLRAKGLDYSQEFDTYERHVQVAMATDTGKRKLHLGAPIDFGPGINIQDGNFNF